MNGSRPRRATASIAVLSAACLVALVSACNDATLPWQLDHDRIVAVRASPPHIAAAERSSLDLLITSETDGPSVIAPLTAAVVPLETTTDGEPVATLPVSTVPEAGGWTVIAPDQATIDEFRAAMGWPPDMPVPVRIAVTVEIAGAPLSAIKTVYIGSDRDNPILGEVTIDGQSARDGLTVATAADIALRIDIDDTHEVDWLTSFGDLSDTSDEVATLRSDEPAAGHVAVVMRDQAGGVVWGLWNIEATD